MQASVQRPFTILGGLKIIVHLHIWNAGKELANMSSKSILTGSLSIKLVYEMAEGTLVAQHLLQASVGAAFPSSVTIVGVST